MFGVAGSAAELEIILLVDDIYKKFGATSDMYTIQLNSRALMNKILSGHLDLNNEQHHSVSKLIDRMHKLPPEDFEEQLSNLISQDQRDAGLVGRLTSLLNVKSIEELPDELKSGTEYDELADLITELKASGLANVVYDATLMRGFDYYTGIVFEVSDNHPDNNRSMMGGGRYDGLVGLFGVEPVPTIGFGLGDATLANFLDLHELMPNVKTETEIYLALAGEIKTTDVQALARRLREAGCNTAIDISGRKLGDQLRTATKKGFTKCLVVGQDELTNGKYSLKNLLTGESEIYSEAQLIDRFKSED
jgi:histidyl-tRNA synthetase